MENVKLCKTKDEFCEYINNYPGELYVKGCNAYKVEGKDKVLIATASFLNVDKDNVFDACNRLVESKKLFVMLWGNC